MLGLKWNFSVEKPFYLNTTTMAYRLIENYSLEWQEKAYLHEIQFKQRVIQMHFFVWYEDNINNIILSQYAGRTKKLSTLSTFKKY